MRHGYTLDADAIHTWAGIGVVAFAVGAKGKTTQCSPDDAEAFAAELCRMAHESRRMKEEVEATEAEGERVTLAGEEREETPDPFKKIAEKKRSKKGPTK